VRALRTNFNGANNVSIDWGGEVEGIAGVSQRTGMAVMTQLGSDKFLPERGTEVARVLLGYGVFDLLGMQHLLNFGALKARSDMQKYEGITRPDADKVTSVQMSLLNVKDNVAQVGVQVTNAADQTTREITEIA
tara:strand:- start:425 stop:826 length:402 start_codon:yes stop_codon:yes gene_type:complete